MQKKENWYAMNKKSKYAFGTTIVCANCGKQFTRDANHLGIKYCSVKCQRETNSKAIKAIYEEKKKANGTNKTIKCAVCGKEFPYDPSRNSRKYCSEECQKRSLKKRNTESEEEVTKLVSYLVSKMNQVSSVDIYTPVYNIEALNPTETQRVLVARRDKNRCRICNSRTNLHIHHIVKRRDGGRNDMDNLITLCEKCHRHIETGNLERAIKNAQKTIFESIMANHLFLHFI